MPTWFYSMTPDDDEERGPFYTVEEMERDAVKREGKNIYIYVHMYTEYALCEKEGDE